MADSPIETAAQAAAYLEGLIDYERHASYAPARLGLGPIRRLLARLGHPERRLTVLHVAGSKGKGSTSLLAEAILLAAGRRVGTFTSPHLERWTERFRVDGAEVEGAQLAAAVHALRPHVDALRREFPDDAPTFFDATTAAAIWLFARAGVERAILEVGLGGRLDSTNAVPKAVACITSIELEHTDKLGDRLADIAAEKAGILAAGAPCITGPLPPEAAAVVAARADSLGVPLLRVGEEIELVWDPATSRARVGEADGFAVEFALPLLGAHQGANAAVAVAAARRVAGLADAELAAAVQRGLGGAVLPGRAERLGARPTVLVDSAHTARSAASLAAVVRDLARPSGRTTLVVSISSGKNLAAILEALLPVSHRVVVTRAEPVRSLAPEQIAAAIRTRAPALPVHVDEEPVRAVGEARKTVEADDLLCITGSMYLAGIARQVLASS